jgi:hypothetical protein
LFRFLTPAWLHGEGNTSPTEPAEINEGELVLYALATLKDAWVESLRQGLNGRFPSRTSDSCLALIGLDRGIVRGRDETSAHYAERLKRWRNPRGHRVRGNSFALLEQFSEYFGGVAGYVIDVKGNKRERTADGVETYSYGNAWDWDGEGDAPRWARFWVVLDLSEIASEQLDFGDPDLWGGELGTPGYTVGQQGVTEHDVEALRRMMRSPRPWKAAGTRAEWVIVSLDGTDPVPDASWLNWSENVAGTQTPTRSEDFRYWSLSPATNNTYAGNPESFCEEFPLVGGAGMYAGDPESFPLTITLTDGSTYAGDPTNFPTSIALLDDGAFPS